MKGIVATGLVAFLMLVSSVAGQSNDYPVFDEEYLTARALSLLNFYPNIRDFNGGGARAKGMGNAYLGVSDDISGITWNPAGLYRQDEQFSQPVVGIGYKSISSDALTRDRMYIDVPWYENSVSDNFGGVDFMSILLPIRIKGHMFVGSAAYSRLGDEFQNSAMALDVMMPFTAEDFFNGIDRLFTYRNTVDYRSWANAYNFGFGTRVYRQLSFGLSVNIYGGGSAERMEEVVSWDSLIVPGMAGNQRAYVQVFNDITDTASYSGVFFTLGFKVNSDRLSGGLIIRTPHVLKQTIDEIVDHSVTNNGYEVSGSDIRRHFDDQLVEIDQPMVLGLGGGFKLRPNWLLAADFEYRAFSGAKVNVRDSLALVPGGTTEEFFTEYNPEWRNCMALRFGSEYMWTTGKSLLPTVPLRAGIGWIQIPEGNVVGGTTTIVDGELMLEPILETASMVRWSLGTGVHWSQIHLDFSYENYSLDRENYAIVREWSVDNSAFDLTFTGYF